MGALGRIKRGGRLKPAPQRALYAEKREVDVQMVGGLGPVFVLLAVAGLTAAADKTEGSRGGAPKSVNDRAFQKAKKEFQTRTHQKIPADRIAALKLLDDFPTPDAADLVYVTLLDDKSAEVREAAVEFIGALREKREVTDKVLARMKSSSRKDGMDIRAVSALKALAGTENEDLQNTILAYLDEFLGSPQANQFLLHGLIDEEAAKGVPKEALRMLMLMTRARFFDEHFGFRRCTVQGLMEVKDLEGITQLINLLPRFKGLVQFDVVSHLVAATGQNFGDDAEKWKTWWTANRGKSQPPEKSPVPPIGTYGQYYGIPICAKRVVFVLDTSLSMRGAKIDAAKTELIRAVLELPKEVYFDLIAFDDSPRVWQRELVPATDQMKRVAVNVVREQPLKFKTASYDALEAAFALDPEAIFFLSDGAPFGGKIDDPGQIISTISEWNRVRRISIHSIGIGTGDAKTDVFGRFMKGLAEANWGVYKPVR